MRYVREVIPQQSISFLELRTKGSSASFIGKRSGGTFSASSIQGVTEGADSVESGVLRPNQGSGHPLASLRKTEPSHTPFFFFFLLGEQADW